MRAHLFAVPVGLHPLSLLNTQQSIVKAPLKPMEQHDVAFAPAKCTNISAVHL